MAKKRRKSKNNNRRKKGNSPVRSVRLRSVGLRKEYLKALQSVCIKMNCGDAYKLLTKQEKIRAFCFRVFIGKLRINKYQHYTSDTLQFFEGLIQDMFYKPNMSIMTGREFGLTNLEILMASQLVNSFSKSDKERYALLTDAFKVMQEQFGDRAKIYSNLMWFYLLISNATNLFDRQVYCLKLDVKAVKNPTIGLCMQSSLESISPRESYYEVNGKFRAVYQLGYLNSEGEIKWTFAHFTKLKKVYRGDKKFLPICIQRHAYHRLLYRLKPLREIELIWSLNHSLQKNLEIQIYRGHILIPYYYYEFKCGYFAAVINKNRLIIKTFLFLTQGATPEGIKLAELSGLTKEEISYWKIGSLRNFIETEDENHDMRQIFEQAGMGHLFKINVQEWHEIEEREYNWNALSAYINRGKTELYDEGAEELDDEFFPDHEPEQY
jgi:hypothetical protein